MFGIDTKNAIIQGGYSVLAAGAGYAVTSFTSYNPIAGAALGGTFMLARAFLIKKDETPITQIFRNLAQLGFGSSAVCCAIGEPLRGVVVLGATAAFTGVFYLGESIVLTAALVFALSTSNY